MCKLLLNRWMDGKFFIIIIKLKCLNLTGSLRRYFFEFELELNFFEKKKNFIKIKIFFSNLILAVAVVFLHKVSNI